ncbi:carcinoembryonic antigen-related cell adhesion molecule 18-like [Trichosurus vulpecula]|uniref:carcinoembryonic antigen-related cell adhesion molecule 18-like n=1 Tax=Trichosurus vulpecula TaxID=9337 RepID=UPI00186B534D|nr:carcinoembryonic antigen-related cell adhesion molecule 18-like [Trichosurus vulpecula]
MALPSETFLRAGSRCKRLLLTATLLASVAADELFLYPENLNRVLGTSIRWRVYGAPTGDVNFTWYRGNGSIEANMLVSYTSSPPSWIPGPVNTGRENVTEQGYLTITELEFGDTGDYTAVVASTEGSQEATGQIQVWEKLFQPNITVSTASVVEYVDIVNFTCQPNNTSDLQIQWYLNYFPVSQGYQWALSSDNRTLSGWVSRSQNGPYYCEVSNPATSQRSTFQNLQIYYGPDFIDMNSIPLLHLGTIKAKLGSSINIYCQTVSQPACLYQWLLNGTALATTNSTLSIRSMSWEDVGTYRCIAENPKTQLILYSTVTLKVYEPSLPILKPPYAISQRMVVFLSIGVSLILLSLIGTFIFHLLS